MKDGRGSGGCIVAPTRQQRAAMDVQLGVSSPPLPLRLTCGSAIRSTSGRSMSPGPRRADCATSASPRRRGPSPQPPSREASGGHPSYQEQHAHYSNRFIAVNPPCPPQGQPTTPNGAAQNAWESASMPWPALQGATVPAAGSEIEAALAQNMLPQACGHQQPQTAPSRNGPVPPSPMGGNRSMVPPANKLPQNSPGCNTGIMSPRNPTGGVSRSSARPGTKTAQPQTQPQPQPVFRRGNTAPSGNHGMQGMSQNSIPPPQRDARPGQSGSSFVAAPAMGVPQQPGSGPLATNTSQRPGSFVAAPQAPVQAPVRRGEPSHQTAPQRACIVRRAA
jgi:hypothetical protein